MYIKINSIPNLCKSLYLYHCKMNNCTYNDFMNLKFLRPFYSRELLIFESICCNRFIQAICHKKVYAILTILHVTSNFNKQNFQKKCDKPASCFFFIQVRQFLLVWVNVVPEIIKISKIKFKQGFVTGTVGC